MPQRQSFEDLKFTTDPRHDIALFSRFFGQWNVEEDGFQNFYRGGGNSSINLGYIMYVKLSGHSLPTIREDGFGEIDVGHVAEGLKRYEKQCRLVLDSDYTKDFSPVMELDDLVSELFTHANAGQGEPSVETGLHAQLSGTGKSPRWNMHDHSTIANGLLCSNNAEKAFYEIFGDILSIRFMQFIEPGAPLSIMFNQHMQRWKQQVEPSVIMMAQHGKIQTDYSPEKVWGHAQMVTAKILDYSQSHLPQHPFGVEYVSFNQNAPFLITEACSYLEEIFPGKKAYHFAQNDLLMKMLHSKQALATIAQGAPNPDAAVYGGAAPMVVDFESSEGVAKLKDRIDKAREEYIRKYTQDFPLNANKSEYLPKIILIPGVCAITLGDKDKNPEKQANNAYAALLDTIYLMRQAEAFGGMKPLSYRHLYYITNWGAEERRKKLAEKR